MTQLTCLNLSSAFLLMSITSSYILPILQIPLILIGFGLFIQGALTKPE